MSSQAWFTNDEPSVEPGAPLSLSLALQNLGTTTETYTILPTGLTASWVTVTRPNPTVFEGSQDLVEVVVKPPRTPTTSAGPTSVSVRVIPESDPETAVVVDADVEVRGFSDRRIVMLQPVQRARRRATYEFMVENHGNGMASCRLRLIDPTERVDGRFDPPAVGVGPGGASLVRLKAKARRGIFRRVTRTLEFDVEAEEQGHDPATGAATLVQPATIPAGVIGRVAVIAAIVGGAAAAWFGVVKPEIESAADDAVKDQIGTTRPETVTEPDTDAPEPTVAPIDAAPAATADEPLGAPTLYRLSVEAPLTRTNDASQMVPDGQVFDLTDVRVENPFNESGLASLLINADVVYQWSLSNIRGQLFEPSLTPIRLQPGDVLTFSVRCDGFGDSAGTSCTTAVNIGGRLIPIDEL